MWAGYLAAVWWEKCWLISCLAADQDIAAQDVTFQASWVWSLHQNATEKSDVNTMIELPCGSSPRAWRRAETQVLPSFAQRLPRRTRHTSISRHS